MSQKNCWGCGSTFYSDVGAVKCAVCKQTEAITQQHQRQADLNRQHDYEMQRMNDIASANRAQAIMDAEHAKVQAINRQTRVIMESITKPQEAYDRGYSYIDYEFLEANPANMEIIVGESGRLSATWNNIYVIPRLQDEFKMGVSAKLWSFDNIEIRNQLEHSAYLAGRQTAEGSLNSCFTLCTGVEIDGIKIPTDAFNSNLKINLNEHTGELDISWDQPFEDEELNDHYKRGASEVYRELNTDELKRHRLENDVIEMQQKRYETLRLKKDNKIYNILLKMFPFVACYAAWEVTEGLITFFSFIVVYVAYKVLQQKYHQWQNDNQDYLYY